MKCTRCLEDRCEEDFNLWVNSDHRRVSVCNYCKAEDKIPYRKQRSDPNHKWHYTSGVLYYIKIVTLDGSRPDAWKVGVTSKPNIVGKYGRYGIGDAPPDKVRIEIIKVWPFPSMFEALDAERVVLDKYITYYYKVSSPLLKTGTTEMFCEDVYALDLLESEGNPPQLNTVSPSS